MSQGYQTAGAFVPDNLIAGDAKIVTQGITVASGQGVLPRGAVLGRITDAEDEDVGKYVLSGATSVTDGSQTPDCILAEAVDATSADVLTVGYLSGQFNQAALTLGNGHTLAAIRDGLRDKNIYLTTVGGA
ncbi:head decoration protein [Desulfovibrio sulfodismutans]|uniref:Head decoration protein n=1 Tax=Desulfolutivibrio sulfodismutans TaxID=63561 RepID=A0A7K3NKD8_9BACT|nr:head decoration protein [Desulfolutivibrio sulfodismutans]NDY56664.1 head decoration protein [Desulfolutivibrio sulfodismutans]QLA11236.1 head decoration protein [Desulfolutivibrio sulfodismutans DSM 3696]